MFTLDSPHFISLIIALVFSLLVHFSFTGFTNKVQTFFISIVLFPVFLMALTLFVPQDFLQISSYLLVLAGFSLAVYKLPQRLANTADLWRTIDKKEKWLIAALVIYLLSFYMSATVFGGSGLVQDSLVYHLEGPKEWALYLNGAKFNPNNPITFTTSYYDYYYYFLFLLAKPLFVHFAPLASTQYEFLSYTMLLSAQIFTGIVGLVFAPLLILRFSSSLGLYKYLAIFFLFGMRLITWSWVLPKNDAYSFLCFLLSADLFYNYYIVKKDNGNWAHLFWASLIVGIGTASKLTNSYVVIFSLLFLSTFHYKDVLVYIKKITLPKAILIVSIGMFLGSSVFLLRNFLYTGNPFYPIAKFGFPNIYLSAYADRPQLYSDPGTWASALLKIKMHFESQLQLVLLLLLALFTRARMFSLFYVLMVVYMSKQTGPMFNFRMTTIFLVLALILFVQVVQQLDLTTKFRSKKMYSGLFIFVVLMFAKIQVEKLVKYPVKFYSQTTGTLIKDNVGHWDIILKNNLENRNNPQYVFAPELEIFPYFSRYPAISLYDSVPKYRYDYYKK
ncbi:MAG: hypothetical protein ACXVLQ_19110 [Bacteriovorax sp.]